MSTQPRETEKNVTTIQVTDIVNARTRIDDLHQSIGAKDQIVRNLEDKVQELKDEIQESDDSQPKVLIVKSGMSTDVLSCKHCGYLSTSRPLCPNCGATMPVQHISTKQYLNMEDVKADLKKEIAFEMNNSVANLEDQVETLVINVKSSKNELKRERKVKDDQIAESKSRARDRYNKLIHGMEKEYEDYKEDKEEFIGTLLKDQTKVVKGLNEELDKVKNDKTNKELEAKRKKEIADLIEINGKLEIKLEQLAVTSFVKRAWAYVINKDNVRKEAIQEHQEMKDRVEEIVHESTKGRSTGSFWMY